MKRVLISGASGFIGSNVLQYLHDVNTDWEFRALCSWRHRGSPRNLFFSKRLTVETVDLRGPIPDSGEYDYILNLASESHVDRSITDPVNFIENNVSTTLQMLEYARKHKPSVFIQFSTDEVYGAKHHEEWDVLLPGNPYAASKAAQEMIAIAYWKTYRVPVVITNSNNIIGPNQDIEKFVPKVASRLRKRERVPIHVTPHGPGRRYWNPVENVSDALNFILRELKPISYVEDMVDRPDRFSLGGGMELNNLQMAQLIAKTMGKSLLYDEVQAEKIRPGYDEFYAASSGMLENLGWKPPITLEEGLSWLKE